MVDTIGQTTKTFLDNYRTPHGDKLHVVERYRLVDGGNALQADMPSMIRRPSCSPCR